MMQDPAVTRLGNGARRFRTSGVKVTSGRDFVHIRKVGDQQVVLKLLVVLAVAFSFGCESSGSIKSTSTRTNTEKADSLSISEFPPASVNGTLHFVFGEQGLDRRQDGYKFCVNVVDHRSCNANYYDYVGKQAYIEYERPEFTKSNIGYYRVVVENGEVLRYRKALRGDQRKLNLDDLIRQNYIVPFDIWNQLKAYSPEPLVPGSDRMLVSKHYYLGHYAYSDQYGNRVFEDSRNLIRQLSSNYGNNPQLADALSDTYLTYDNVKHIYSVQPADLWVRAYQRNGELQLSVELRLEIKGETKSAFLYMALRSDNPISFESFVIAVGESRYRSGSVLPSYSRDFLGHEASISIPVDDNIVGVLRAIAAEGSAKVRIEIPDEKTYVEQDFFIDAVQVQGIRNVLRVFELIW